MSEIIIEGDTAIVKPGQDIVASMVEKFKSELKQAFDRETAGLTIDFTGVEMLDSMGIGILIAAHNSIQKKGGRLGVINASDNIVTLLKNMRLDKHFNFL